MTLQLDACIAQHQGDRKEQQDRIALIEHRTIKGSCLAIVADGMGGHTGGAEAAEQVVFSASSAFQNWGINNNPRVLLRDGLFEAHDMIVNSRHINEQDPHSTAVMFVLLPDKRCFWSHCGDSRLYCFRNDKMLFRTRDHSYVEHLIRRGKITREDARNHPNRNVLITSLGGKEKPRIEFGDLEQLGTHLMSGDNFLLCSDGLWGYFEDDELAQIIYELPAREAVGRLIGLARERAEGEGDNISVALLKFKESEAHYDYRAIMEARAQRRQQEGAGVEAPTPSEGEAESRAILAASAARKAASPQSLPFVVCTSEEEAREAEEARQRTLQAKASRLFSQLREKAQGARIKAQEAGAAAPEKISGLFSQLREKIGKKK